MDLEMRLPRFVHVGPNNYRHPSKRKAVELESERKDVRMVAEDRDLKVEEGVMI